MLPLADVDGKMHAGFSRGAYQVRALAGVIHEVGKRTFTVAPIDKKRP